MNGKKTPIDIHAKEHIQHSLSELKYKQRFTQKEIAEATGIVQPMLSQYFSGKKTPTEDNLQKLADFFQVAIEDIDPRYRPNIILGDNAGYNGNGDNTGTITINNGDNSLNTNITNLDMLAILGEILRTDRKILKTNEAILNHLTGKDTTKNASQTRGVNPVKK